MKNTERKKIIVILGPTASGKSGVAIRLAKKFGGEVISADSRQIYRGMDVGTGKVPMLKVKSQKSKVKEDYFISNGIRHHLLDIVSPKKEYNVSDFKKDCEKAISDILIRGKLPIICGGTGFWIKAVVDNVSFPEVAPDPVLRNKLRNKPAEKLFAMLQKLDHERAKNIDPKNKVRLIRAIEIATALGKVPKLNYESRIMNYEFLQIGIVTSKEKLHKRIEKRLKERFEEGMIEEVEKLKKSGLSFKKIQIFGLGYFWIPLYLKGKLEKEELFEKVCHAEKDYAKRQMTWFSKNKRILWLKNYKEIEKETGNFLS